MLYHNNPWHLSGDTGDTGDHGPIWRRWVDAFLLHDPRLTLTARHDYLLVHKQRYQCTGPACGKVYGRHKRTIKLDRHACIACGRPLRWVGRFDKLGRLLEGPGEGGGSAGGTPATAK
ncbi:HMG box-containing protein C19G7.04, partial [Tetrabaena socialis]